ncbi:hypothetical protein ABMA27_009054 [Loxostege sticticalis]|uniref:Gustatory receptor n=1 Tax=Loxostege sticticalis TaxID=481309 RepID=A0ABR3H9S9_LOXSC
MLVAKNTFHDYLTDLYSFDAEIEVNSSTYRVETKIIVWFLIAFVFIISMGIINCFVGIPFCKLSIYVQLVFYGVLVGLAIVHIVYTFVFYSGYLRLKNFTSFVKDDGTDIISCQYLYKSVAGMIENAKKSFDVVERLFMYVPTWVILLCFTLQLIFTLVANTVDGAPFGVTVMISLVVGQRLLMLFSPAVTAGLLARQVEQLKLVLYNKLLKGKILSDKSRMKDIKRFVAYIDGRPLRFKVWRVVPLDWRLPVIVLNIAVTYLIVMIQFTHNQNH